jgi:hypothetical protein
MTDAPYTPGLEQLRKAWAAVCVAYRVSTKPTKEACEAEFDRAIAAHVADEVERLAEEIEHSPTSDPGTAWFNKDMSEWVRERAAEIREGKN